MKVPILGTGTYGMDLASFFYNNKLKVNMWTNNVKEKDLLLSSGKSNKIDYVIPKDIMIYTDMKKVIDGSLLIVIVVPRNLFGVLLVNYLSTIIIKLYVLLQKDLNILLKCYFMMLVEWKLIHLTLVLFLGVLLL